jgi:tetratricopeptide (TPR) repeat protein
MNKAQILAIMAASALFLALYFGCDTKHINPKTSPSVEGQQTNADQLLQNAKSALSQSDATTLTELEKKLSLAVNTADKTLILKQISAFWYQSKQIPVAGDYAEVVAALENSDSSWSVAGGTFYTGLVSSQDPVIREYCATHAVIAFEKAASLSPDKVEHQVNQALVWAENPPKENPMKAVLALRDLEKKYPASPSVYNALGRLAIKTGQWQRAVDRFEKSWSLDKKNSNTPCLLARAYEGLGNTDKSTEFSALCKGQ